MIKEERRKAILNYILTEKSGSVSQLAEMFQVSAMTVRRDLTELEKTGRLIRVSGGAMVAEDVEREPTYKIRMFWNSKQKETIASIANALVQDADVIFLDVGTTCLRCAEKLYERDIVVVTNWIPNIMALSKGQNCEIINTGGVIKKSELLAVGVSAYNAVGNYSFTRALIGVAGLTEGGISDYNLQSVEIKRRAIDCAREVIVLADHSKFGKQAPVHIASLDKIDKIIVADIDRIDSKLLNVIGEKGIEIISS